MGDKYSWEFLAQPIMTWGSTINLPWFVTGTGIGVPAGIAIGSSLTNNVQGFTLVTTLTGFIGGVAADFLSTTILSHWEHSFTAYDVLTKGAGPACLFLVVLSRGLRTEPFVAVKPAAIVALAALLLEPLFNAYVIGGLAAQIDTSSFSSSSSPLVTAAGSAMAQAGASGGGGVFRVLAQNILRRNRKKARAETASAAAVAAAASAMSRACWLTAGAQLALWIAVVVAYARLSLRLSDNQGDRRSVKSYMKALGILASKKRGNGGWSRMVGHYGRRALPPNGLGPWGGAAAADEGDTRQSRAHTSSLLGSLYERFARGRSRSGRGTDFHLAGLSSTSPLFDRGEVTVRDIHCTGLDAAITGRPAASIDPDSMATFGNSGGTGADGGGGIAGGKSRPFYVTITIGSISARTSVRAGFAPRFTEVFPLGGDCPIRGGFLVITVVDCFETGRSGRGDRIVGEVHLPLEAAQLVAVPGMHDDPRPVYRLSGDWELQGILGAVGEGATVGAEVDVRGPPSPTSAAGRLRRRRESVGWYAR